MSSPRASPAVRRKVNAAYHHRKKHVKLGISRKLYSLMGLSGAEIEKEYVEPGADEWYDVHLHTPNERREPSVRERGGGDEMGRGEGER